MAKLKFNASVFLAIVVCSWVLGANVGAQPRGLKGIVLGGAFGALPPDVDYFGSKNAKIARYQIFLKEPNAPYTEYTIAQHVGWINAVMPTIISRGMVLVVDFHVPNRTFASFQVGTDPKSRSVFYEDWARIVAGVGHHPSANMWFELANEQIAPDWPAVALTAAQRIRTAESARNFPRHPICYSPTGTTTSGAKTIQKLAIDGPQVLTFHFWNWKVQDLDVQQHLDTKFRDYGDHMASRNKAEIGRLLDVVKEAGTRNGCPVFISEVGIDYRHEKAAQFFYDFTAAASARQISVTWHANDGSYWFGSKRNFNERPGDIAHFENWFR